MSEADDESGWAQPARRGVVMVLATAVLSVSVLVVTLGATPGHPRRATAASATRAATPTRRRRGADEAPAQVRADRPESS